MKDGLLRLAQTSDDLAPSACLKSRRTEEWRCLVVLGPDVDQNWHDFDARYEVTPYPVDYLWGPGSAEDSLKWLAENEVTPDEVRTNDRIFAIRLDAGRVYLPTRLEILSNVPGHMRHGIWQPIRADFPNDAHFPAHRKPQISRVPTTSTAVVRLANWRQGIMAGHGPRSSQRYLAAWFAPHGASTSAAKRRISRRRGQLKQQITRPLLCRSPSGRQSTVGPTRLKTESANRNGGCGATAEAHELAGVRLRPSRRDPQLTRLADNG